MDGRKVERKKGRNDSLVILNSVFASYPILEIRFHVYHIYDVIQDSRVISVIKYNGYKS